MKIVKALTVLASSLIFPGDECFENEQDLVFETENSKWLVFPKNYENLKKLKVKSVKVINKDGEIDILENIEKSKLKFRDRFGLPYKRFIVYDPLCCFEIEFFDENSFERGFRMKCYRRAAGLDVLVDYFKNSINGFIIEYETKDGKKQNDSKKPY